MLARIAKEEGLRYFLGKAAPEPMMLRLFVNDVTPGELDQTGTYQEAKGYGYEPIELHAGKWEVVDTKGNYPTQTFTFGGPLGKVCGYFITRKKSGRLVSAAKFEDGPYVIKMPGDCVDVNIEFGF